MKLDQWQIGRDFITGYVIVNHWHTPFEYWRVLNLETIGL